MTQTRLAADDTTSLVGRVADPDLLLRVSSSAAAHLQHTGYLKLDDLWQEDVTCALTEEAKRLWPSAQPPLEGYPPRRRPGTGRTLGTSGPVVQSLGRALTRVARACSGQFLVFHEASYSYYTGDDELFLHVDTPVDLTFITGLLGNVGPLHLHPELEGLTRHELAQIEADPAWDRSSGMRASHPRAGVTAFCGRRLPHHRPGHQLKGLGAVALFAYRKCY